MMNRLHYISVTTNLEIPIVHPFSLSPNWWVIVNKTTIIMVANGKCFTHCSMPYARHISVVGPLLWSHMS